MAEKKQLSVFWGKKFLYFVETLGILPNKIFKVSLEESKSLEDKRRVISTGNLQLTSRIQNALRQHKVSTLSLNLSLPAKDIIFRSFLIPRLHPSEIKNVVDFEARKYLPFDLKTLSYSYYPMPIFENNLKKLQIIFVAIKKSSLEKYTNLFEQATLDVNLAEPEPISLVRLLYHKNLIWEDKTVGILTVGKTTANLIIASQRIPCFVREIQIAETSETGKKESPEEEKETARQITTKLLNEIRISIEYYKRQSNQTGIDKFIIVTNTSTEDLSLQLQETFDFEISVINPAILYNDESIKDIEPLNAYGACLFDHVETPTDFILSGNRHYSKMKSITSFKKATETYKSIIITALLGISITTAVFIFSKHSISSPLNEIKRISDELGSIKDASTQRLRDQNTELETKLENYFSLRQKSHVALFLSLIPQQFPEGIWMTTLDIYYPKDAPLINKDGSIEALHGEKLHRPRIELSGYAYLDNTKEQFKIVSKLINNLKKNKILAKVFANIELKTIKSQRASNLYETTFFKINFE